jgi:hypothetical protein
MGEKNLEEQDCYAQADEQDCQRNCRVVQAFGQAALGAVDVAFTAEDRGQAAILLLHEDGDDQEHVNANEGENKDILEVFHKISDVILTYVFCHSWNAKSMELGTGSCRLPPQLQHSLASVKVRNVSPGSPVGVTPFPIAFPY